MIYAIVRPFLEEAWTPANEFCNPCRAKVLQIRADIDNDFMLQFNSIMLENIDKPLDMWCVKIDENIRENDVVCYSDKDDEFILETNIEQKTETISDLLEDLQKQLTCLVNNLTENTVIIDEYVRK